MSLLNVFGPYEISERPLALGSSICVGRLGNPSQLSTSYFQQNGKDSAYGSCTLLPLIHSSGGDVLPLEFVRKGAA